MTSTGTMGTKARYSSHLISHRHSLHKFVAANLLHSPQSCYFNREIHEHRLTLLTVLMCIEGLVAAMRTDLLHWRSGPEHHCSLKS